MHLIYLPWCVRVKWLERACLAVGIIPGEVGSGNRWLTSLSVEQNPNQANSAALFSFHGISSLIQPWSCSVWSPAFFLLWPVIWIKWKDSLRRELRRWFNFQIFWGNIRQISREKRGKEAVLDFLPCKYTTTLQRDTLIRPKEKTRLTKLSQ